MGDTPRGVRYGLALMLAAVAVFFGLWAYDLLVEQLWGYRDSPSWLYLSLGLPLAAISLASIVGIALLLRLAPKQPRRKKQPRH